MDRSDALKYVLFSWCGQLNNNAWSAIAHNHSIGYPDNAFTHWPLLPVPEDRNPIYMILMITPDVGKSSWGVVLDLSNANAFFHVVVARSFFFPSH